MLFTGRQVKRRSERERADGTRDKHRRRRRSRPRRRPFDRVKGMYNNIMGVIGTRALSSHGGKIQIIFIRPLHIYRTYTRVISVRT